MMRMRNSVKLKFNYYLIDLRNIIIGYKNERDQLNVKRNNLQKLFSSNFSCLNKLCVFKSSFTKLNVCDELVKLFLVSILLIQEKLEIFAWNADPLHPCLSRWNISVLSQVSTNPFIFGFLWLNSRLKPSINDQGFSLDKLQTMIFS